MSRLTRVDAAFLAVAGGIWVSLAVGPDDPWIDRFFGAVMFTCLLALLRLGLLAWLGARAARRHAAEVRRVLPDEAARRAVEEERARLSTDIVRSLRETLAQVAAEVEELRGSDEPLTGLRRIQAHARRATSDLRRQLGLLRDGAQAPPDSLEAAPGRGPARRDVAIAAAVTSLAAVESTAYLLTEGYGEGVAAGASVPVSVGLSTLAAASILLRRAAPVAGSLWCAAAFGLGTVLGSPVSGGFWAMATVGALPWALAANAAATVPTALVWLVLSGSIVHSRLTLDPDNAFIFALVIGVATVLGLLVRLGRARGRRAAERALAHEQLLQAAARTAVQRERQQFAREIHDVVSHAVGLVAMQAAAAEVSWPHNPDAVERAVAVIGSTAESTLAEVDRLLPGAAAGGPSRIDELVERIRRCGTPVELVQDGELPPLLAPLAYRIVQEGLTNAVRHAPGARVSVRVVATDDGLTVGVEDDGPGPDDRHQPGYGLVGIEERVSLMGGTVSAGPAPGGRGFRLHAHVPTADVEVAR